MDHTQFFEAVAKKLHGNCKYTYNGGKSTYEHYRAANGNEVQINITTRFQPKNTVRIQLLSTECPSQTRARQTSHEEALKIEEQLDVILMPNRKPAPSKASHNEEYTYYTLYFPFVISPMEVADDVAEKLIGIFNILS